MDLARISDWLRNYVSMRLQCSGCKAITDIGFDSLIGMSAKNDDLMWWRERFRCRKCGAKAPHMSSVRTHLTPDPTSGEGWNPLTQTFKNG
jgi:hypothetical protein